MTSAHMRLIARRQQIVTPSHDKPSTCMADMADMAALDIDCYPCCMRRTPYNALSLAAATNVAPPQPQRPPQTSELPEQTSELPETCHALELRRPHAVRPRNHLHMRLASQLTSRSICALTVVAARHHASSAADPDLPHPRLLCVDTAISFFRPTLAQVAC